ncbi:sulfurylase small subunit [Virgibacillus profundi]|uniref:Sulfurylase small subunit n=1 Tax=Virgibacillus profundi TaxID=2024555 RepID=A0A2A2IDP4_9BACI|nr:XdhC family protein [Virgibacillus profundi]PAV29757.1 sulfurylase small subunit [Virgibacillus profundi]PXY53929.1 XdhC family protein [Virgibacillus profundi]
MNNIDFYKKVMSVQNEGIKAAVATIIGTKGSTPRRTGAKMIIFADGEIYGTIGGGCGEGEVIEKSFSVMDQGIPAQHQVDLTEGLFYEDGGICGGIMDVFIEPIHQINIL